MSDRQPVVLVGTNHVSEQSSMDVRSAVRRHQPDVVAIELGETRAAKLRGEDTPLRAELLDTYQRSGALSAGINLCLATLYSVLDGPADGGDMMVGARTASAHGCGVALIDRDIHDTLPAIADGIRGDWKQELRRKRDWLGTLRALAHARDWRTLASHVAEPARANLWRYWTLIKLELRTSPGTRVHELPPELVRGELLPLMEDVAPGITDALLHSRDDHLAGRLHALRTSGKSVVAVLGALHVHGVAHRLRNPETIPEDTIQNPEINDSDTFQNLL